MTGHNYIRSIIFSCVMLSLFTDTMDRPIPLDLLLAITADMWEEESPEENQRKVEKVPEEEFSEQSKDFLVRSTKQAPEDDSASSHCIVI